jgi:copper chaperone CopZ
MMTVYRVTGMTCDHCVNAVTQEVKSLEGVTEVHIVLNPGGESTLEVQSTLPLGRNMLAGAVGEAGYTLKESAD